MINDLQSKYYNQEYLKINKMVHFEQIVLETIGFYERFTFLLVLKMFLEKNNIKNLEFSRFGLTHPIRILLFKIHPPIPYTPKDWKNDNLVWWGNLCRIKIFKIQPPIPPKNWFIRMLEAERMVSIIAKIYCKIIISRIHSQMFWPHLAWKEWP